MARRKTTINSNWKPSDIFLLPKEYKNGMTFPGIAEKSKIQERGFGSCSFGEGLDRPWTLGELTRRLIEKYPKHRTEMEDLGVQFARLLPTSKKIMVHVTKKDDTVAKLEQMHGRGILIILVNQQESIETEPLSLVKTNAITIAHLNCQSVVRNKLPKLIQLLEKYRIDIFTISETWLNPSHKSERYAIPKYTIVARKDRVGDDGTCNGTAHGGVMVYVKDHLVPLIEGGGREGGGGVGGGGAGAGGVRRRGKEDSGYAIDQDLEAVYVDISFENHNRKGNVKNQIKSKKSDKVCMQRKVLRVVNVYVPPATRVQVAQLKKLNEALCELKAKDCCQPSGRDKTTSGNKTCKCQICYVILGDFNCDWLMISKELRSVNQEKINTLREMEEMLVLKQLIKNPTREGKTTSSVLDLIFTDKSANIDSSGVIQLDISDHFMVYCRWISPVSGGSLGTGEVKKKGAQKASLPIASSRPLLPVVRYPKQAPRRSKSKEREH